MPALLNLPPEASPPWRHIDFDAANNLICLTDSLRRDPPVAVSARRRVLRPDGIFSRQPHLRASVGDESLEGALPLPLRRSTQDRLGTPWPGRLRHPAHCLEKGSPENGPRS